MSEIQDIAVSIIIPAYNAEETLKGAVDSVLNQTLSNIEIIIVNDGSTDATRKVISTYEKECSNIVVISKKNEGVSAARNAGITVARGEFIAFLDADDAMESTMLEKMYNLALKEDADAVQCGRIETYPDGTIRKVLPNAKLFGKSLYESPGIFGSSSFIWDKIYRNSIIKENQILLDNEILYAEENAFILQVFLQCKKISVVREGLYLYNARRLGAATYSFDNRLLDNAQGIEKACKIAINVGAFQWLEKSLWNIAKGCYCRRVNDFMLYDNKVLQKKIIDSFFELFDNYFWNWKDRFSLSGKFKRFFYADQLKFIDKKVMYRYIESSNRHKKLVKDYQDLRAKCKHIVWNCKKKLSNPKKIISGFAFVRFVKKIEKQYLQHKNAIRYAKYKNYEINPNAVLLSANSATIFNGNIYYMTQTLIENNPDLDIYVVSNNIKRDFIISLKENISPRFVKSHSEEHIRLLATAKYLISNTKLPTFFIKKQGQIYMNTWHGTPLKTLGKSMCNGKKDMALNQKEFFTADFLLYPNKFSMEKMMADFELNKFYQGKVVISGYPRNAVFFREENQREEIRKSFGLMDKKVYVYMPTWRGKSVGSIDKKKQQSFFEELLQKWNDLLNDNIVVFVKLHPYIMKSVKIGRYDKIRAFPTGYETYLFLNIADGLITDYSSVMFDFANTQKEILLFTYDKEEYLEERGMYFDMATLPFPQFKQLDEMIDYMNCRQTFCVSKKYQEFLEYFCSYDNVNAAEIVSSCLLTGTIKNDFGEVIDYTSNQQKDFRVIFMPALDSEENQQLFNNLCEDADEKTIFTFFKDDITPKTDMILNAIRNEKYSYIVVPGEMVTTLFEAIKLVLYRKFHICKKSVRTIYLNEVKRIFYNISIKSFENYSDREKFKDIETLLK